MRKAIKIKTYHNDDSYPTNFISKYTSTLPKLAIAEQPKSPIYQCAYRSNAILTDLQQCNIQSIISKIHRINTPITTKPSYHPTCFHRIQHLSSVLTLRKGSFNYPIKSSHITLSTKFDSKKAIFKKPSEVDLIKSKGSNQSNYIRRIFQKSLQNSKPSTNIPRALSMSGLPANIDLNDPFPICGWRHGDDK